MPVVKFSLRLDLEEKISFLDRHILGNKTKTCYYNIRFHRIFDLIFVNAFTNRIQQGVFHEE